MNYDAVSALLYDLGSHTVRSSGNGFLIASCPLAPYSHLHNYGNDKSPSLSVSLNDEPGEKSIFKCFTCKSSGTLNRLIGLVEQKSHIDYSHVRNQITENENYIPDWEMLKEKQKRKVQDRKENKPIPISENAHFVDPYLSKFAKEYLSFRGIGKNGVIKSGLRYDSYDKRLVFPVIKKDKLLYGYTGRSAVKNKKFFPKRKVIKTRQWDWGSKHPDSETIEPNFPYMKIKDYYGFKKKHFILGEHLWDKDKPVLIIEGLIGYLHLLDINADSVFNIGAIMGSSLSDYQAEILINFRRPVYLLLDNDDAGYLGIYGDGRYMGAFNKLEGHIPVVIPKWPMIDDQLEKIDPDQLTLDEIKSMKK